MKTLLLKAIAAVLIGVSASSCTTTYDAYGAPRQTVDPLAAAAVAGVAGYAIGQNNGGKYYYGRPYYGYYGRPYYYARPYYYRGYYGPRRYWR